MKKIIAVLSAFIAVGSVFGQQLGTPTPLQRILNELPAIPIAGRNLKFQFSGTIWIATVNGENALAGTVESVDINGGSILTLKQTHIWAAAAGRAVGGVLGGVLGGAVGNVTNIWVATPGPEIVLDYSSAGPRATLSMASEARIAEARAAGARTAETLAMGTLSAVAGATGVSLEGIRAAETLIASANAAMEARTAETRLAEALVAAETKAAAAREAERLVTVARSAANPSESNIRLAEARAAEARAAESLALAEARMAEARAIEAREAERRTTEASAVAVAAPVSAPATSVPVQTRPSPTPQPSKPGSGNSTVGYGFLNIAFWLGSYMQGDTTGGLITTGGLAATLGLIAWELNLSPYNSNAGVPGTVGLAIGAASVIYGFIRPYAYNKNHKLASAVGKVDVVLTSSSEQKKTLGITYTHRF